MSITSPAGLAVSIFGQNVTVFEETSTRVKGRVQNISIGPDRQVFGSIQPARDKDQQYLPKGVRSEGALIFHSFEQLNLRDVNQDGVREQTQSFVRYKGETWRVSALQDWTDHSGAYRYVLTKYISDVPA